ncbi:molybdenum cofactor biosynthesis protein, partial [Streptomyces sp. SID10244]|nr:molybdenum cofactor biosynthesis protein [Streptomyces sp. SID10244]
MSDTGSTAIDPDDAVAADAAAREFVARHSDDDVRISPSGDEIGRALVVVVDDRAAHG